VTAGRGSTNTLAHPFKNEKAVKRKSQQPLKKVADLKMDPNPWATITNFIPIYVESQGLGFTLARAFALLGNDARLSICYSNPLHRLFPRKM